MYRHINKIHLRKLERCDLDSLLETKNESWWGTHEALLANSEDQLKWFENIGSKELFMTAFDENHGLIGVASYTNINWISRSLSASGIVIKKHRSDCSRRMFEAGLDFAFEILNMHRVEGEILEYHIPAQRLDIDHLGFVVEGRKRSAVYKCGNYYDSLVIGILREEWQNTARVKSYNGSCNANFNFGLFEKLRKSCNYFKLQS